MFIILQYPIADVRRFIEADKGVVPLPDWPAPAFGSFVRQFGSVRPRIRGGVRDIQEDRYCDSSRAIRFECNPSIAMDDGPIGVRPYFRRLYANGLGMVKVEIGLRVKPAQSLCKRADMQSFLHRVLSLKVKVTGQDCTLEKLGPRIAALYQLSTTLTRISADTSPWEVSAGTPTLLVESQHDEYIARPFRDEYISQDNLGLSVSHAWLAESSNAPIRLWHLVESSSVNRSAAREFRIALLQLNADRSVLQLVLKRIAQGRISPSPFSDEAGSLQEYVNHATAKVRSDEKKIQSSAVVAHAREVYDQEQPGECEALRQRLEAHIYMRQQVTDKALAFDNSNQRRLTADEINGLAKILARRIDASPVEPTVYVRRLLGDRVINSLEPDTNLHDLPSDLLPASVEIAQRLYSASSSAVNESGSVFADLLIKMLSELEGHDRRFVVAVLCRRGGLVSNNCIRDDLELRHGVPRDIDRKDRLKNYGPDFEWHGPGERDVELHTWMPAQPSMYDIGFLERGLRITPAVCRIQVHSTQRQGTGFLIAQDLVITCTHILSGCDKANLDEDIDIRFCVLTGKDGVPTQGRNASLVDGANAVAFQSSVDDLDFTVLRIRPMDVEPAQLSPLTTAPVKGEAIHILQYPGGGCLQLASDVGGVVAVDDSGRRMQYFTPAKGGSSGAPCFNDDWSVVGVHQAERATWRGSRRQGIPAFRIAKELASNGILNPTLEE